MHIMHIVHLMYIMHIVHIMYIMHIMQRASGACKRIEQKFADLATNRQLLHERHQITWYCRK